MTDSTCRESEISTAFISTAIQPRAALRTDTVDEYRIAMQAGAVFPPVVVFREEAGAASGDKPVYVLADGFHRLQAARDAGVPKIRAQIFEGDRRAATLYAVGANGEHGLRRTNEDKRRAVHLLLDDSEWRGWSDNEIARRCNVSPHLVADVRAPAPHLCENIDAAAQPPAPAEPRMCERNGKQYAIAVENIGRPAVPSARPSAERTTKFTKTVTEPIRDEADEAPLAFAPGMLESARHEEVMQFIAEMGAATTCLREMTLTADERDAVVCAAKAVIVATGMQ